MIAEQWVTDTVNRYQREIDAYEQAKKHPAKVTNKIGRNKQCPCGSGKKYKKCCMWVDIEGKK